MNNSDLSFLIFYTLSFLLVSRYGLITIVKAEKDNSDQIMQGWMFFLLGFTPGGMLISGLFLLAMFLIIITEGPTILIQKLKKHKT